MQKNLRWLDADLSLPTQYGPEWKAKITLKGMKSDRLAHWGLNLEIKSRQYVALLKRFYDILSGSVKIDCVDGGAYAIIPNCSFCPIVLSFY